MRCFCSCDEEISVLSESIQWSLVIIHFGGKNAVRVLDPSSDFEQGLAWCRWGSWDINCEEIKGDVFGEAEFRFYNSLELVGDEMGDLFDVLV